MDSNTTSDIGNYFINQDATTGGSGDVVVNTSRFLQGNSSNDSAWKNNHSGASAAIILTTSAVYCTTGALDGGSRININVLNVNESGDMRLKTAEAVPDLNGLDIVRNAPSTAWSYKQEPDQTCMGPMAQDLPEVLERRDPEDMGGTLSLSLGSMIGVLWDAIRKLDTELDEWRSANKKPLPSRKQAN